MAATATPDHRDPTRLRPMPKRALPWPIQFYRSAVGKKWVMGLTGLMLLGFVIVHMLGNFKAYLGPEDLNVYGESLRDLGGHLVPRTHLLWLMRIGLAGAFVMHIASAYSLKELGRKASRSATYMSGQKRYEADQRFTAANFASRTMRWTGPIILLYLIYHLADLTWGIIPWVDYNRGYPYENLVSSLENWPIAILYIVANTALAIHIYHGLWSAFQSIGLNSPRLNASRRQLAAACAGLVLVGNLSFPIMVQAGVLDVENALPRQTPTVQPIDLAGAAR